MRLIRKIKRVVTAGFLMVLAACSSSEKVVEPTNRGQGTLKNISLLENNAAIESTSKVLADYQRYRDALDAIKRDDDLLPQQFLSQVGDSAMAENVRNQWLKSLAKREQWQQFNKEFSKLSQAGISQEVKCYQYYHKSHFGEFANKLVKSINRLPEGCNRYLEAAAADNLDKNDAWRRVRGLISKNQLTDARNLAAALSGPVSEQGLGAQEYRLINVIGSNAKKTQNAAATLENMSANLTPEQIGFAWGVLGHYQAQSLNMVTALNYYSKADLKQLSDEQFEWYARAALRLQRWQKLAEIIQSMPKELQSKVSWQYWLARSYAALGQTARARELYGQVAQRGRNFYSVLATEELGERVNTRNNVGLASAELIDKLARNTQINRALTLFKASQNIDDWDMRRQAQAEWRYAIRAADEETLLAAAQLAYTHRFYEMAINSAERTSHKLNFQLRYVLPFREMIEGYAYQAGISSDWVYGLIRQESRFVVSARSRVGAHGLMQVMPATAREIAGKLGMTNEEMQSLAGNVRMGTWYLADGKRRLSNSEVLATAGYNAGYSRARRWQAETPLEGAIYAETIPFDETRDYVKKVMNNATYYASLLHKPNVSLKQRLGTVPAR